MVKNRKEIVKEKLSSLDKEELMKCTSFLVDKCDRDTLLYLEEMLFQKVDFCFDEERYQLLIKQLLDVDDNEKYIIEYYNTTNEYWNEQYKTIDRCHLGALFEECILLSSVLIENHYLKEAELLLRLVLTIKLNVIFTDNYNDGMDNIETRIYGDIDEISKYTVEEVLKLYFDAALPLFDIGYYDFEVVHKYAYLKLFEDDAFLKRNPQYFYNAAVWNLEYDQYGQIRKILSLVVNQGIKLEAIDIVLTYDAIYDKAYQIIATHTNKGLLSYKDESKFNYAFDDLFKLLKAFAKIHLKVEVKLLVDNIISLLEDIEGDYDIGPEALIKTLKNNYCL